MDNLDRLFMELPQVEPSDELLERIRSRIRELPGPLWRKDRPGQQPGTEEGTPIVHNEMREPS